MRGAPLRVEVRRNGEIAARFEDRYVQLKECQPAEKKVTLAKRKPRLNRMRRIKASRKKQMDAELLPAPLAPFAKGDQDLQCHELIPAAKTAKRPGGRRVY